MAMNTNSPVQCNLHKKCFSLAEKIGMVALLSALSGFVVSPLLASIPLVLFLLFCLGAPFFPQCSFFLPIISRGKKGNTGIALTFDDGPSPISTPIILDLLARHSLKATFFVIGEKVVHYPHLLSDIIEQGHSIGNHSWKHDPFLMLRSQKTLQEDIHNTQALLKKSGGASCFFRPPAGITNPRLAKVLAQEDLITVTYSCRAFDRGNRNVRHLADRILGRVCPGDIIMLHDLPPFCEKQTTYWQRELDHLLAVLQEKYDIVPLRQII